MQFSLPIMPIQSIYNVLLPIKYLYSGHILATIKISHVLYIRAGYLLLMHYLHDTSMTPHPSHRGAWG